MSPEGPGWDRDPEGLPGLQLGCPSPGSRGGVRTPVFCAHPSVCDSSVTAFQTLKLRLRKG